MIPSFSTSFLAWLQGMAAMRGVGGPGFWAPKITAMDALQVGRVERVDGGFLECECFQGVRDMIFWDG